jgi:TPR repeat protein
VDETFAKISGRSLISADTMDHLSDAIGGSADQAIRDINANFDVLVDALRRRQAQLIEEVNVVCAAKCEKLRSQIDNISLQLSRNYSLSHQVGQSMLEESKSWIVEHVDELVDSMTNQLESDANMDYWVVTTSSDIQYIGISPDCMSTIGSVFVESVDRYLSKLYCDARMTGSQTSIDELLHVVNNSDNVIARGFYSALLHRGLLKSSNNFEVDKLKASNIMGEVAPTLLHQLTNNINCSSNVPLILGMAHDDGININVDKTKAYQYYKMSADQGNALAQNYVGWCYQNGIGVHPDKAEAFRYYKMSADQGNADAQNKIGWRYQNGDNIDIDKAAAFRYYKMSANQGNSLAQNNIGWCYQNSIGVNVNNPEAFRHYKMSADQGNTDAQNNVGFCYQNGVGVKADKTEAFRYYKMSSNGGSALAQNNIGWCYQNGNGVDVNKTEAFRYYKMSADQGNADAQYTVGFCYENGNGIAVNKEAAFRYYYMSADQGNTDAKKKFSPNNSDMF